MAFSNTKKNLQKVWRMFIVRWYMKYISGIDNWFPYFDRGTAASYITLNEITILPEHGCWGVNRQEESWPAFGEKSIPDQGTAQCPPCSKWKLVKKKMYGELEIDGHTPVSAWTSFLMLALFPIWTNCTPMELGWWEPALIFFPASMSTLVSSWGASSAGRYTVSVKEQGKPRNEI